MASSSSSFTIVSPSFKHYNNRHQPFQVRAQSRRDGGGRSSNGVDANLRVLKERIEVAKMKEKLERCCRYENGWNYAEAYNYSKVKRKGEISEWFELLGLVGATIGSTCFTGTLFLCLLSIFVHLHS